VAPVKLNILETALLEAGLRLILARSMRRVEHLVEAHAVLLAAPDKMLAVAVAAVVVVFLEPLLALVEMAGTTTTSVVVVLVVLAGILLARAEMERALNLLGAEMVKAVVVGAREPEALKLTVEAVAVELVSWVKGLTEWAAPTLAPALVLVVVVVVAVVLAVTQAKGLAVLAALMVEEAVVVMGYTLAGVLLELLQMAVAAQYVSSGPATRARSQQQIQGICNEPLY
jgi:hypothetical protein